MKQTIHHKAMESLKQKINKTLKNCEIKNSMPDFNSYSKNLQPFINEVLKHKKEWITTSSIHILFNNEIISELIKHYPDMNASGNLSKLHNKIDINKLSESIMNTIETIPRESLICFPLPGFGQIPDQEIQINADISIKKITEKDIPPHLKTSGFLGGGYYGSSNPFETYLCIREKGYTGNSPEDLTFLSALSKYKQITHLGIIYGLFFNKQLAASSLFAYLGRHHIIDRLDVFIFDLTNPSENVHPILMPDRVSSITRKIGINEDNKGYQKSLSEGEESLIKYFKKMLKQPSELASSNLPEARPIQTAIEWAFDASTTEDDTVSFLQTCIGLEAILGDNAGNESLTKTLADRCAYLISPGIEGRKKLKENFTKLYDLRSALVHGRKIRLKDEEKYLFEWGKNILTLSIIKEMGNLKK